MFKIENGKIVKETLNTKKESMEILNTFTFRFDGLEELKDVAAELRNLGYDVTEYPESLMIEIFGENDPLVLDKIKKITVKHNQDIGKCNTFNSLTEDDDTKEKQNVDAKIEDHIHDVCDKLGFESHGVRSRDGEFYIDVSQYTPEGEDWWETIWFDGTFKGFADAVVEHANNFDVDKEAEVYISIRGTNGVPNSISDLLEDARWKKRMLTKLGKALKSEVKKNECLSESTLNEGLSNYYSETTKYFDFRGTDRFFDVMSDLVERTMNEIDVEDADDINEAIQTAIEEGLFYNIDEWEIKKHYEDPNIGERTYNLLISDISKIVEKIVEDSKAESEE